MPGASFLPVLSYGPPEQVTGAENLTTTTVGNEASTIGSQDRDGDHPTERTPRFEVRHNKKAPARKKESKEERKKASQKAKVEAHVSSLKVSCKFTGRSVQPAL